MPMEIKTISIRRPHTFEKEQEFRGEICLSGGQNYPADINLKIPQELLVPIVAIISKAAALTFAGACEEFHTTAKLLGETASALIEGKGKSEEEGKETEKDPQETT